MRLSDGVCFYLQTLPRERAEERSCYYHNKDAIHGRRKQITLGAAPNVSHF